MIKYTTYGILIWMFAITSIIFYNNYTYTQIGPNENLKILGFHIDTIPKYITLITLCMLNSGIRSLNQNILHPYMLTDVQNINQSNRFSNIFSYQVTSICAVYTWFDWYFYINILLAQVDMVFVEIFADIIISNLTTYYYLKNKNVEQENEKYYYDHLNS